MSLVAGAGGAVRVAYLSDGSQSHPASRSFPPARIAELRAQEARAALGLLGVREEPLFFGLLDGSLAKLSSGVRSDAVERLARAMEQFEPEVVLAPWQRDPHPDHVAAAAIAADAVAQLARMPTFAGYEVWLPVRGEDDEWPRDDEATAHEIPLDDATIDRKRRAILAHRTQTSDLIDDDPQGFRIDESMLETWLGSVEFLHEARPRSTRS